MPKPARFRVVHPGFFTTVQDLGRVGFQRFGTPVSGAMDLTALRLANRLVGNADHSAALEITVQGPELLFESDAVIAITGGDLSPSVNGAPVPNWTTLGIQRGGTLAFGSRRSGARAYVAVAGGVDVPVVLGSRSTHIRSRTGGVEGRALMKGDVLVAARPSADRSQLVGQTVPDSVRPAYSEHPTLRLVLGPQADLFVPDAVDQLITGRYTVSPQSDRMGYRLRGPALTHAGPPDIVSDATPTGALQVPANQQPILLMADRQTTGGYPKIAVVISADLPLAAQLIPGDTIGFTLLDVHEAQAMAREHRARIDEVLPPEPPSSDP